MGGSPGFAHEGGQQHVHACGRREEKAQEVPAWKPTEWGTAARVLVAQVRDGRASESARSSGGMLQLAGLLRPQHHALGIAAQKKSRVQG
jgi:hypothetical protein